MNIPSSIKGFSTPAPDFPEVIGLPLFPLTKAIVNALKERFAILGLQYPSNVAGAMYDIEEGNFCYGSILGNIDRIIGELGWYYFNQYLPWDENVSYGMNHWTWEALSQKAAELLDIPESEQIGRSSSWTGGTLSTWPVHRAAMVSLLTHINLSDWTIEPSLSLGKFQLTTMEGDGDDHESSPNAYNKAVANAKQKVQDNNRVFDYYHMWYRNFYGRYETSIDMMTKFEYIPKTGLEHLLQGKLIYHGNATPWYNDWGFYNFGAPIVEGYNAIQVPSGSGIILSNTFPRPPQSFTQEDYQGWHIEGGHLVGDYSEHFQYGMSWGESA